MTLVPFETNYSTSWFILSVHVEPLKIIFKNSLTGIFQTKYNYTSVSDRRMFQSIIKDCCNYIDLFYYEKLCSQFSFYSKIQSKSICDFQQNSTAKSFLLKPWFMGHDLLNFCLDPHKGLRMKISQNEIDAMVPSKVSFSEDEFLEIIESLFHSHFIPKLQSFFENSKLEGYIEDFSISDLFQIKALIIYDATLHIRFDPLTKTVKLRLLNCTIDESNLSAIFARISDSLINLNSLEFNELIFDLKRQVILHLVSECEETLIPINCPEINSSTGICFHFLESPKYAISINLSTISESFELALWSLEEQFTNGCMNVKFSKLENGHGEYDSLPKEFDKLIGLLQSQIEALSGVAKFLFINEVVKKFEFDGKFISEDSYLLYSFGQPSFVKCLLLCSLSESEICAKFILDNDNEYLSQSFDKESVNRLPFVIANNNRLLSIYDAVRFLKDGEEMAEIESFTPLRIKLYENVLVSLETNGGIIVIFNGERNSSLEKYFETDSCSVYGLMDLLNNKNNSERGNVIDNSLQDTAWLSGTFM